jgi:hypothetical protein
MKFLNTASSRLCFVLFAAAFAFLGSCGSSETVADKELSKDAILGTRPNGSDSSMYGWFRVSFDANEGLEESSMEIRHGGQRETVCA